LSTETLVITGKDLVDAGWAPSPAIKLALAAAATMAASGDQMKDSILARLEAVRETPQLFAHDAVVGALARHLQARPVAASLQPITLSHHPAPYPVWGRELIDPGAIEQMDVAMRLPISVAGALMPDAHIGYGLPIGGVLETKNVVIPYAVGSDIACRMRLTILDVEAETLRKRHETLKGALQEGTTFGAGKSNSDPVDSPVLHEDWNATKLLRTLRPVAIRQLGTSGSGNHFVEWGEVSWGDRPMVALMSHSGSRAVGFRIADLYSKAAESLRAGQLPKEAIRLSWLDLDSELGEEYWRSMELAGFFASENHRVIHERVIGRAGLSDRVIEVVENHHNFAWRADRDGDAYVVHRKGATPAGPGVMGVIPGSMADKGYVVAGKGNAASLESASHGAGRRMGRRKAEQNIRPADRDMALKAAGVTLLGGGLDESPQAYKPIDRVIAAQSDLVEIRGTFFPKIVRMDAGSRDI
jgi:tRNA-splicing ligase RtcB